MAGYDLSVGQIEQLWQQLEREASAIEILEEGGNMLERLQFHRGKQSIELFRVWRGERQALTDRQKALEVTNADNE